jgi:hypothetical protein
VLKIMKIREVYLWKNAIGDEGAEAVAAALENHPTIEVLYLGYVLDGWQPCNDRAPSPLPRPPPLRSFFNVVW